MQTPKLKVIQLNYVVAQLKNLEELTDISLVCNSYSK